MLIIQPCGFGEQLAAGIRGSVLLGAIGGVAAWGLIGVFTGPVVLAIGLAIWREWAAEGNLELAHYCSSIRK